jgi:hypothetical protein
MLKRLLLITFFLSSTLDASEILSLAQLDGVSKTTANWLVHNQIKQNGPNYSQFAGEWPSYMVHETSFFLLGKKGKKAYDSNNFSVSNTFNLLAELYLAHPNKYEGLKETFKPAIKNIEMYYSKNSFNFWPLLPKNEVLIDRRDNPSNDLLVHRPNNYELKSKFINNAANVVNDADDTAISYIALKYFKMIFPNEELNITLPISIAPIFDQYRDENRGKVHFFNALNGIGKTKAYLTWLDQEAPYYRPWEKLPKEDRQYIPYRTNDVDCVVNTNVLAALATYQETEQATGYQTACDFINNMISKKNMMKKCGVYYPNKYTLHYTAAKAHRLGAQCLASSIHKIHQKLITEQLSDGSYHSEWKGDEIQSTAYALLALFELDPKLELKQSLKTAVKAIEFLYKNMVQDENGTFWPGGVFFSGGTVVRKSLVWQSDAYTTAQILTAIQKYIDYLEQKDEK